MNTYDSKKFVKEELTKKGYAHLYSDENYRIAKVCTNQLAKTNPMWKQHFLNAEGFKELYMVDLIIHNKK